jgi:succinate dehydrogenase / fumarate reductase cytochrome b subunit
MDPPAPSFLERHDFLIRRLHSLSGLIPVGAYMVIHLATNATVLNGPAAYQKNVYTIHSLGGMLPVVEWVFIFIPILFHGIVGMAIVAGAVPNTTNYPYESNWRYTLQRWTGVVAFVFIMWHVFHMHGWFHSKWWLAQVAEPYGGAQFRAYNATSTAALALREMVIVALYGIGVLASVFHLANGIWTMGITWGVWTSEAAQRRALAVCGAFGVLLAIAGLGALGGMNEYSRGEKLEQARDIEARMYRYRVDAGEIMPSEEKRAAPERTPEDDLSETERDAK